MDAIHLSHDICESKHEDDFSPHKFWIAVCAELRSHPIVGYDVKAPKPADPKRAVWKASEVWQWLLFEAAWKPRKRMISGCEVYLARGQVAVSQRYLAEAANWGRKAIRAFFERLEKAKMATFSVSPGTQLNLNFFQLQDNSSEKGPGLTIITICNYDRYQNGGKAKGPAGAQQGPSRGPAGAQNFTSNLSTSTPRKVIPFPDLAIDDESPEDRCRIVDGRIVIGGSLLKMWLQEFDGDETDLRLALIQADGWVKPNEMTPLEKQVSRQLAKYCRERRERSKNYSNRNQREASAFKEALANLDN